MNEVGEDECNFSSKLTVQTTWRVRLRERAEVETSWS